MVLPRHECIQSQVCPPPRWLPVDSTLSPSRLAPPSSSACLPRLAGPPRPQIRCPRTLNCPPCQLPTSAPRVSAPHAYLSLRWSMTTGPCTQQHCLPEPSAAAPARTSPPPRPPPSGSAPARARNRVTARPPTQLRLPELQQPTRRHAHQSPPTPPTCPCARSPTCSAVFPPLSLYRRGARSRRFSSRRTATSSPSSAR